MKKTKLPASGSFFYSLLIFFVAASTSCTKDADASVLMRVNNLSSAEISDVVIYSLDGEFDYGNLGGGTQSPYKKVGNAYNSPACRFTSAGREYNIMVRCATPPVEKISSGHYAILIKSVSNSIAEVELIRE